MPSTPIVRRRVRIMFKTFGENIKFKSKFVKGLDAK